MKGWTDHILGACAECAVAKVTDNYWYGSLGDMKARDVDEYQVRSTELSEGCLLVHEEDQDDHVFILVTGVPPRLRIQGWTCGREAKKKEFWTTRFSAPAFFAPQSILLPMDQLWPLEEWGIT
jgi:hypothetical protein